MFGEGPTCRKCGCSEFDACYRPDKGPCSWVAEGLCSHCARSWEPIWLWGGGFWSGLITGGLLVVLAIWAWAALGGTPS